MKVYGEFAIEDVLPYALTAPGDRREYVTSDGQTVPVAMYSTRYLTFLKSLSCVACGLTGTFMRLECGGCFPPHFNLYARKQTEHGEKLIMLTQDHIVPLSKGGPHELDNLQTMCSPCNRRKGAFYVTPEQLKEVSRLAEVYSQFFAENAAFAMATNEILANKEMKPAKRWKHLLEMVLAKANVRTLMPLVLAIREKRKRHKLLPLHHGSTSYNEVVTWLPGTEVQLRVIENDILTVKVGDFFAVVHPTLLFGDEDEVASESRASAMSGGSLVNGVVLCGDSSGGRRSLQDSP